MVKDMNNILLLLCFELAHSLNKLLRLSKFYLCEISQGYMVL